MEKVAQVLIECIQGRKQYEISRIMGWKEGATGTVIRRLMDKNFLEKTERGTYKTTEKGKEYVEQYVKKYQEQESRRIDNIVYNAYNFRDAVLKRSSAYVSMFTGMTDLLHIDRKTRTILQNIKKIYMNSVDVHLKDEMVIAATWADHDEPVCKDHKFNYNKSYDANASDEIKNICRKEDLFTSLHKYSRISLSLKLYWIKK
ncbi:MAG TPA: hypothetical protein VFX64_02030 [Candidatus Nitrosotalea sp.]|nr:hypothetical protein [Candidatus Nitrosotalea sp.]